MGKKVPASANEARIRALRIARDEVEERALRLVPDREGLDAVQWVIYSLEKAAKAQFAEWDRKMRMVHSPRQNWYEKREELRFLAKAPKGW